MNSRFLATFVSIALLGAISAVEAAETARVYHQNAPSACQGALPAFAGTLRARPLGLGNEGDAAAFVTCGFPVEGDSAPFIRLSVYLTNKSAVAAVVNCTAVAGKERAGTLVYMPKSVNVAPNAYANLAWQDVDNGGADLIGPASLSCQLPPGTVILDTYIYFTVEIGD